MVFKTNLLKFSFIAGKKMLKRLFWFLLKGEVFFRVVSKWLTIFERVLIVGAHEGAIRKFVLFV